MPLDFAAPAWGIMVRLSRVCTSSDSRRSVVVGEMSVKMMLGGICAFVPTVARQAFQRKSGAPSESEYVTARRFISARCSESIESECRQIFIGFNHFFGAVRDRWSAGTETRVGSRKALCPVHDYAEA